MAAFAAAAALFSTPGIAAEAYTMRNTYGAEVNVLEVTQSEAREAMREVLDTQVENPDLSLQESYRLKVLFNWHIRDKFRDMALEEGYDQNKANSLSNALTNIYGRYIVENDGRMDFQAYEFNPHLDQPINYTPSALHALVTLANGEKFAICGIGAPDTHFTVEQWYEGFTGQAIQDGVLPDIYSTYMRNETMWHERSHCFFIGNEAHADYYAVLQLLNENYDSDNLDEIIGYLEFKAEMWMYAASTDYLVKNDENRHVGAATLAALQDFKTQQRRLSEEEIWTMATDLTTLAGTSLEAEVARWESILDQKEEQAIQTQRELLDRRSSPALTT